MCFYAKCVICETDYVVACEDSFDHLQGQPYEEIIDQLPFIITIDGDEQFICNYCLTDLENE